MEATVKKGVALNPNTYTQLTDHLAPLAVIMDIPLLLTDEEHQRQSHELYPGVQTWLEEWENVTPEYLISHFDVFFQSEPWERQRFYALFQPLEEKYQKEVRNVHCPHGFSDKLFWLNQCVWEDITLVYGTNMLDMFKEQGLSELINAYVRTGNYRYTYYKQHQAFFDQVVEQRFFSRFAKKQPVILYAPTCNDPEKNTSFLDADPIFEKLPSNYNLLVKLHPVLEDTDSPSLYHTMGKYERQGNIVFVKDFPPVYPLLARSDIYIGDMSSIGYDFLAFNRPMFFLNQRKRSIKDRNTFLFQCGVKIEPEEYHNIYAIIEKQLPMDHLFKDVRTHMYQYTFGEEIPFEHLKESIYQSYFSPKKW